jgi:GNAT superfamily N-acetyltransferase
VTVRVRTLGELTPRQASRIPALFTLDGGEPWDVPQIHKIHRWGANFVPYHGVYATEGDDVLGQIQVIRTPFTTSRGTFTVSGLDYVVCRPDALRRGLASRLLEEVRRREAAAGMPWIFLWTRRSWGAHRAYEKAGYRDIYSYASAQKGIPRGGAPSAHGGYRWRSVQASDAPLLEGLLRDGSRGRCGFVPRPEGSFRWRFRLGWRRPEDYRLLLHRGRAVGYALVQERTRGKLVSEVVLASPEHQEPMLRSLEGLARGRWLVFVRTSFVRDVQEVLQQRGYDLYPLPHGTLMVRRAARGSTAASLAELEQSFRSPRFFCHEGDMF